MSAQRITKRIVDAVQPGEKDTYVWDTDLKGFGLKVTPKKRGRTPESVWGKYHQGSIPPMSAT